MITSQIFRLLQAAWFPNHSRSAVQANLLFKCLTRGTLKYNPYRLRASQKGAFTRYLLSQLVPFTSYEGVPNIENGIV